MEVFDIVTLILQKVNYPNIHRLFVFILLPIGLLYFIFATTNNKTTTLNDPLPVDSKQKGAHVFGILDSTNCHLLTRNNIEWVTFVTWGYQDDYDSPIVRHHNGDSTMIQKSDSSWRNHLAFVHSAGFKIFVKPHIWVSDPSDGKWRADIFPANEDNWKSWKKTYRDFILRYANLSQQANAEMFCIGTELSRLSVEKPVFWKELIREVRRIYSGKIVYAANWYNEFEKITFWEELDYIGIQAYFPLVKNKYPTVQQISKGWNTYLPSMESVHKKFNRQIVFTEMGYKSTADSAIEPWVWMEHSSSRNKAFSAETQANCYKAFFNTVWTKNWLAGVHIWQLRSDYTEKKNTGNNRNFTPLGKPAEKILSKGFEIKETKRKNAY